MHFDASCLVVNLRHMTKLPQIKVGSKFSIGSDQKVEIEGCRHPEFVVVSSQQLRGGLFQVCAQQEGVAALQNASDRAKKFLSCRTIKVHDRICQEEHAQSLAALAVGRHLQQTVQVLAFKPHNADSIDVAEFSFADYQSRAPNFDRIIRCALAPKKCPEEPAGFLPRPPPHPPNSHWPGKP